MDIIRTDWDAKFHTKVCCCCFGLKTGSTIIAVINLLGLIASTIRILSSSQDDLEIDEYSNGYVDTVNGKTTVGKVASTLVNLLVMSLSGSMLWGNIKGDKKLMLPYVYVGLVVLIFCAVIEFIAVLTLIFTGAFFAGFVIFFVLSIFMLLQLYYWEVVRCRVLELDQLEQPRSCQQDPELPAYGDIQGTRPMSMPKQEEMPFAYANAPPTQMNYE